MVRAGFQFEIHSVVNSTLCWLPRASGTSLRQNVGPGHLSVPDPVDRYKLVSAELFRHTCAPWRGASA
jgi:hypothetical protein